MATQSESGMNRIEALAKPKSVPPGFLDDRRSVYWVDYVPPRPGNNGITAVIASSRVEELARHRSVNREWKGDRPTPMWPVNDGAKSAQPSHRIEELSRHRTVYLADYKMERSPYSEVTPSAKGAKPSQRIEALSIPKQREDRFGIKETHWGQYYPTNPAAMKASPSERIESLAQAKGYHGMFRDERSIQWQVPDPALKAIATLRLQQMSRPLSRTMTNDDYDPYRVPVNARRAKATPRVEELCVPIPRKVRSKKVV